MEEKLISPQTVTKVKKPKFCCSNDSLNSPPVCTQLNQSQQMEANFIRKVNLSYQKQFLISGSCDNSNLKTVFAANKGIHRFKFELSIWIAVKLWRSNRFILLLSFIGGIRAITGFPIQFPWNSWVVKSWWIEGMFKAWKNNYKSK